MNKILQHCKLWLRTISFVLVSCLLIPAGAVFAAGEVKVSSTVAAEDAVYIYVRGMDDIQSDSAVQIGATVCPPENISVGRLTDLEVPMRTILLVDNSYSIPEGSREDIRNIMTGLINQALPDEQFKIGVFSDTVTYLCDYTADTDTAVSCVNAVEYQNQDTYFSDVLYDVLTQVKEDNSFYLTRIIMISDGADDNEIGYTNAEVRTLVGESGIPVYTVGTKGKNNSAGLEEMFAFSRAANAEYYLLDGSISTDDIVTGLLADQGSICIRIKPDAALLDGSHKKILLKLQAGEETVELTTSADMPFASGNVQQETTEFPDSEESAENQEEEQESIKEGDSLPTIGGAPAGTDSAGEGKAGGGISAVFIAAIVAVAVLLILVIVVFLGIAGKKKKAASNPTPVAEPVKTLLSQKPVEPDKTELVIPEENSDKTVGLWDSASDSGVSEKQAYLVLRSLDDPSVMYKVPIRDVIHIGRSNADIVIDNKYVSARHCDITLRGDLLYLKDTGSSNGTFYENMAVHDEVPIVSGGKIRIAKSNFSVELIKE